MANTNPSILDLPENLFRRVEPEPNSGCWLWTGGMSRKGYGMCYVGTGRSDSRYRGAHRVVYELLVGVIAQGLVPDHLCRVRSCVNPSHLEPVTDRVNILRGDGLAAKRHGAEKCSNGHSDWMPHRNDPRYRLCRTCERIRKGEWQRARRAAIHGVDVELVRHAGKSRGWR